MIPRMFDGAPEPRRSLVCFNQNTDDGSGGDTGGGGDSGGAPPGFSVPTGPTTVESSVPGSQIPTTSTQTSAGPAPAPIIAASGSGGGTGGPGQPAFGIDPATGQPFPQFAGSAQLFDLHPAGVPAPLNQTNVDLNPPYTIYPPGVAAPTDNAQLSSDVLSPKGLMLSALMFPPDGSMKAGGWNALDPATRDLFTRQYGDKAQSEWEKENAKNQQAPTGGSAAAGGSATTGPAGYNAPLSTADIARTGMAPGSTVANLFNKQYGSPAAGLAAWQAQNGGGGTAPVTGGMVQTVKGQMPLSQVIQALRQAGNAQPLDSMSPAQVTQIYNDTASGKNQQTTDYNAQVNAQRQADTASAQQNARNSTLPQLVQVLNNTYGPAAVNTINSLLGQMGLPPLGTSAGPGVMPNGISPAQWDAMPDAAKQIILQAWSVRAGGDPATAAKDFIAQIDSQRPHGAASSGGATVQYAPLAA